MIAFAIVIAVAVLLTLTVMCIEPMDACDLEGQPRER
jgi:hypothetical protein